MDRGGNGGKPQSLFYYHQHTSSITFSIVEIWLFISQLDLSFLILRRIFHFLFVNFENYLSEIKFIQLDLNLIIHGKLFKS